MKPGMAQIMHTDKDLVSETCHLLLAFYFYFRKKKISNILILINVSFQVV